MGGKTKTSSNSTQTNTAYAPVKPVIDQGAGIMNQYLSNPNSTAVYGGPQVADLSADTRAGIGQMHDSTGANDAMGFFKNVMNTPAGRDNPEIAGMQDSIRRQVLAANASQFSNAGTTGGTQHQESLARGLSDGLAQPLFAAYEADKGRQIQAAGALPGIDQQRMGNMIGAGQIQDSYNQNKINADRGAFEEQRTAPIRAWNEVAPTAMNLGTAFGTQTGQQNSVTKQSQSPLAMIGGGLMAGAGLMTGNPMLASAAGGMFGGGGGGGAAPQAPWTLNPAQFTNYSNQITPNERLPWSR
jgi:hypothetical protein